MKSEIEWIKLGDEILAEELDVLMCPESGNIFVGYVDEGKYYYSHDSLLYETPAPEYWAYLPTSPISIKKCTITNDECVPYLLKKSND